MKKEKVKKFWKEHQTEIVAGIASGLTFLIGYGVCMHDMKKANAVIVNDSIRKVLFDSHDKHGSTVGLFTGITTNPVKPDDLGKLGEVMMELDTPKDAGFTHFIAIGPTMKN